MVPARADIPIGFLNFVCRNFRFLHQVKRQRPSFRQKIKHRIIQFKLALAELQVPSFKIVERFQETVVTEQKTVPHLIRLTVTARGGLKGP